ncbi:MFS transporter [Streptomyces sp. UNOC14_S4]|uniref:MFS transporter n=1 Tax=Streptomyces sp. UNOC14_S4 TaxID=2872340 RepID=UPI001E49A4A1|nr:MFS transporter [Streptomyces sp. UNOC14_S4]MCC3767835.1 MFS transporter [Streptomyces sp. UNOC14_S4]
MPRSEPSTAEPGTAKQNAKKKLSLLAACLGFVVVILDVSVVNVATDALSRDFDGSLAGLEWVVNGYTLTFAAFLLSAGSLGDRFDPKRIYQAGFALFAVASFACGASTTLVALIVSRVVQGLGAAMIVPSSLSIVNKSFPVAAERARAVSLWAAAGGLALALGPVVGGVLIDQLGWRSVFFVNVPIAVAGIWLTQANAPGAVRGAAAPRRSFDVLGQVLAVVALGSLTTAVIEANGEGWGSAVVVTCLAVFVTATTAFVTVERRSADPMLPPRLFSRGAFTATSLIGVLVNFAFYGLIFVFSLFFQSVRHYSPIVAGLAFLPMTATIMTANLASGPLAKRYGARAVLTTGSSLAALGCLGLLPAVRSGSYGALVGQFLVAGFGIGLVVPAMTNAMLSAVDSAHVGIASGVLNASRQLGGLIGVAIMGLLVGDTASAHFTDGLRVALGWGAAGLVGCAVLSAYGLRHAPKANRTATTSRVTPTGVRP